MSADLVPVLVPTALLVASWIITGRVVVSINKRVNKLSERVSRIEGRMNGEKHDT